MIFGEQNANMSAGPRPRGMKLINRLFKIKVTPVIQADNPKATDVIEYVVPHGINLDKLGKGDIKATDSVRVAFSVAKRAITMATFAVYLATGVWCLRLVHHEKIDIDKSTKARPP